MLGGLCLEAGGGGCEMGRVYGVHMLEYCEGDLSILDACGNVEAPKRLRKCRSTLRGRNLS